MCPARKISPHEAVDCVAPHRRLLSTSPLTTSRGQELLKQLADLQNEDGDILWTVGCNGGNFYAGIELYRAFAASAHRVIGLANGNVGSAAFMAFQGCHLRLATPSSTLRIHNPRMFNLDGDIGFDTTETDYLNAQREWFRRCHPMAVEARNIMIEILLERSACFDYERLHGFLEAEKSLNPEEAIALGFLDAVCKQ